MSILGAIGGGLFGGGGAGAAAGGGALDSVGSFLGFGQQNPYWSPTPYNNQALNGLVNNPNAGAQAAVSNPYLSGILGPGGSLNQAEQQAQQLQNTGFSLQPQDNTAYGQASNQAAQMYGSQGQSLANSLASRGFGAGNGGNVAGAQFTGLQGSKNEQLANAQFGIANARMNFAQNALNSTRQAITGMGGLGNQYAGIYNQGQESAANAYNTGYEAQNNAGLASAKNQQGQLTPTFGQTLGSGIGSSVASIGSAPGTLVNSTAGSLGKSLGSGGLGSGGGGK